MAHLRFCFVLLALPFIRGDWRQMTCLIAAPVPLADGGDEMVYQGKLPSQHSVPDSFCAKRLPIFPINYICIIYALIYVLYRSFVFL